MLSWDVVSTLVTLTMQLMESSTLLHDVRCCYAPRIKEKITR